MGTVWQFSLTDLSFHSKWPASTLVKFPLAFYIFQDTAAVSVCSQNQLALYVPSRAAQNIRNNAKARTLHNLASLRCNEQILVLGFLSSSSLVATKDTDISTCPAVTYRIKNWYKALESYRHCTEPHLFIPSTPTRNDTIFSSVLEETTLSVRDKLSACTHAVRISKK